MTEFNPDVDETSTEPSDKSEQSVEVNDHGTAFVEFSIDDTNHDYAKGVFLRQARNLQADFVELYKEDPAATFRLTLERL